VSEVFCQYQGLEFIEMVGFVVIEVGMLLVGVGMVCSEAPPQHHVPEEAREPVVYVTTNHTTAHAVLRNDKNNNNKTLVVNFGGHDFYPVRKRTFDV
jgi:hypothetical protein